MNNFNRKSHWEIIYEKQSLETVSWYQPNPITSLNFINQSNLAKTAKIIDVGGGDGYLADHLLELGYQDITVLDISSTAIERAKKRLGTDAQKIKWIVTDISDFKALEQYDFWHDRAAFHFLTKETEIEKYLQTAAEAIAINGKAVIGTFSEQGPKKCSGIEIKQYSEQSLTNLFQTHFEKTGSISIEHQTPFNTIQDFVFCSFQKKINL